MGASQEKKARKALREDGKDKRQIAQQKAEEALKRRHRTETGVSIFVVVAIAAIIFISSNLLYTNFSAVKIGDQSYTAAEYNFFYKTTYNNFVSQYGDYISYIGLDTTKSLDSQTYEEGKTWADYFKESALSTMKEITAMYAEAQKNSFVLSDEDQATLDSSIANLKTSYEGSDYSSANAYLASVYGKGSTVDEISGLLEKYYVSQAYATQKNDSLTYTNDEIKAYYAENKDNLDKYTYISYLVDGSVPDTSTDTATASASPEASAAASPSASPDAEAVAAAMASAKTKADAIVEDTTSADTFKQAVLAQTQAEASESTTQGSSLSAAYADWLKDAGRVEGDTTVIETDSGYYTLYYISRDDNNYKTVNVRHILIKAVASDDGTYSEEAKATAKAKAEDLLEQWKAGDATEDSFATLANANTEDTGSNTNGGLYENVYKDQMVAEFNDWCFAEGRKTGDTTIVYNEGSYTGYHVIYYVGEGSLYCDTLAETAARDKDYTAWKDSILANYEAKTGFTEFLVK